MSNWWKLYCSACAMEPDEVRRRLKDFANEERMAKNRISSKTISNFGKNKSVQLSGKTAAFLKVYLTCQPALGPTADVDEILGILEKRLVTTGLVAPKGQHFNTLDPYEVCAQSHLDTRSVDTEANEQISGWHRIIRYNAHGQCLSADLLHIRAVAGRYRIQMISESGQIYRGSLAMTDNIVHMFLICPKPRKSALGFSVRTMIFHMPRNVNTNLISGLLLRTSNTLMKPIVSCVLVSKVKETTFLEEAQLEDFYTDGVMAWDMVKALIDNRYIGEISEYDELHKLYCRALSAESQNGEPSVRDKSFSYWDEDTKNFEYTEFKFYGPMYPPDAQSIDKLFPDERY